MKGKYSRLLVLSFFGACLILMGGLFIKKGPDDMINIMNMLVQLLGITAILLGCAMFLIETYQDREPRRCENKKPVGGVRVNKYNLFLALIPAIVTLVLGISIISLAILSFVNTPVFIAIYATAIVIIFIGARTTQGCIEMERKTK